MKARCLGEAGRILCCLCLATECWQQELAISRKGVPLTITDIAAQTGIAKQNVRRGILQLKAWGLADIQGERDRTRIYSWVKPRPVIKAEVIARDPWTEVPEKWRPMFRRFKVQPLPGFSLKAAHEQELYELSKAFVSASDALKAGLRRIARDDSPVIPRGPETPARDDAIQSNERNSEKNPHHQALLETKKFKKSDDEKRNPEVLFAGRLIARHGPGWNAAETIRVCREELAKHDGVEFRAFVAWEPSKTSSPEKVRNDGYYRSIARLFARQTGPLNAIHETMNAFERVQAGIAKAQKAPRCTLCQFGKLADGSYCECRLGRDLKHVESRPKKREAAV